MPKNASEIPSVVAMSTANIGAKRDIRYVIRDCIPALYKALDQLGDEDVLKMEGGEVEGRIQHVDLTHYYVNVADVNSLLCEAYNILGDMHNAQTVHGESVGIHMDAPNSPGGR